MAGINSGGKITIGGLYDQHHSAEGYEGYSSGADI